MEQTTSAFARDPYDATLTAVIDLMRVLQKACEALGIPDSTYRPVSYTHLDVYKRQP